MPRVRRVPVAGLAVVVAAVPFLVLPAVPAAAVVGTATAAGTTTTDAGWSSWQRQALSAVAAYRDEGPLTAGRPGPVVSSTVATPSGPLAVAQRTLMAEDSGGQVLVQMAVLGQTQVVVTERGLTTAGLPGATLVLRPGRSTVAGTYARPATRSTAAATGTAAAAHRGRGRHGTTNALVRHVGPPGSRHQAPFTVTSTCSPTPEPPFIFNSTFGPLVDGEGVVNCTTSETLSLIVSIFRGLLTHVGTTASGSSGSPTKNYSLSSFYFCTAIAGTHDFRTSELWGVGGVQQGGATSSEVALHCT